MILEPATNTTDGSDDDIDKIVDDDNDDSEIDADEDEDEDEDNDAAGEGDELSGTSDSSVSTFTKGSHQERERIVSGIPQTHAKALKPRCPGRCSRSFG